MNPPNTRAYDFHPSREAFCQFCRILYDRHLAAGVGGNVAARVGDWIWLTPTGCSLRDVQPAQIAVVDVQGTILRGAAPSKEADMHLLVLRHRPDVNVVCHLHGAYIIAASTLLQPGPDTLPALTPGFVYYAFPLPMLAFMTPGSPELAGAVAGALRAPKTTPAVLLQNHGLVTVGKNFKEALDIAEEIDEAAHVYVLAGDRAATISERHIQAITSIGKD
jgi:3-dehydro-4-phosphotetronate decarboxylase